MKLSQSSNWPLWERVLRILEDQSSPGQVLNAESTLFADGACPDDYPDLHVVGFFERPGMLYFGIIVSFDWDSSQDEITKVRSEYSILPPLLTRAPSHIE